MNYAQHNKELDGTLYRPETPVVFTKADSALLKDRKPFFVPDFMGRIDYENATIAIAGKTYPLNQTHFPTIDPADPYALSDDDLVEGVSRIQDLLAG